MKPLRTKKKDTLTTPALNNRNRPASDSIPGIKGTWDRKTRRAA
jgi:hypothetical protein